jgi:hypothetical protein
MKADLTTWSGNWVRGIRVVVLAFACAPLCACVAMRSGFDGQVLEKGTNQPISGAIVVSKWSGTTSDLVHSHPSCVHVATAKTDEQGRYHIDAWATPVQAGLFSSFELGEPRIWAYKRGYAWVDAEGRHLGPSTQDRNASMTMEPFKGTEDERLKALWLIIQANNCHGIGINSQKNLYRLYAPMYEEAQSVATTPYEMDTTVKWIGNAAFETLVNWDRPTDTDSQGNVINVNPTDSYHKEDLLK